MTFIFFTFPFINRNSGCKQNSCCLHVNISLSNSKLIIIHSGALPHTQWHCLAPTLSVALATKGCPPVTFSLACTNTRKYPYMEAWKNTFVTTVPLRNTVNGWLVDSLPLWRYCSVRSSWKSTFMVASASVTKSCVHEIKSVKNFVRPHAFH